MARKTVGYTHLQWTCPACGHKNPGTAEKCSSCQAPQPADVAFEQPAQEKLLTDDKTIARAKAGPDIHCPFCGTRNQATATHCTQCGGDLAEGTARPTGSALGTHKHQAAPDIACAYCGTMNPADAPICSNCGASVAANEPKRPSPQPQTSTRAQPRKNISPLLIGLLIFGCLAAAILAFMFSRTEDVIGRVKTVEWERTITIEALGSVSHEDWLDDIPSNASVGVCTERVHHTQSNPAPGANEVCGEPYTVDTGTGLGEVVQDCEYQVYESWCEYTAMEWQTADSITAQGNDYNPIWPHRALLTDQREGSRQENYLVTFDTDGNNYSYSPSNLDQFTSFQIGSQWLLEVNTFDIVMGVSPTQ
jgi:DNA-directed RNA polymerase subunit RPC12/RpoP